MLPRSHGRDATASSTASSTATCTSAATTPHRCTAWQPAFIRAEANLPRSCSRHNGLCSQSGHHPSPGSGGRHRSGLSSLGAGSPSRSARMAPDLCGSLRWTPLRPCGSGWSGSAASASSMPPCSRSCRGLSWRPSPMPAPNGGPRWPFGIGCPGGTAPPKSSSRRGDRGVGTQRPGRHAAAALTIRGAGGLSQGPARLDGCDPARPRPEGQGPAAARAWLAAPSGGGCPWLRRCP